MRDILVVCISNISTEQNKHVISSNEAVDKSPEITVNAWMSDSVPAMADNKIHEKNLDSLSR